MTLNRFIHFLPFILWAGPSVLFAQGVTRQTYHDPEKRILKEVYQVRDTISNILQGKYISYYMNGNVESKGQFTDNETSGVWEFYYETGNLKMRGVLLQNTNFGFWEYFYENGKKSMEGIINGRNREGEWKTYYENGQLKESGEYINNKRVGVWKSYFEDGVKMGEIEYKDDFGRYTEYYHSGKVLGEGPKSGTRQVGHWRYFAEDGTLESEGDYVNGKKSGDWTYYYSNGNIAAKGKYESDDPSGMWEYYYEDGKLSSKGEFKDGNKNGYWKTLNSDGSLKSEITYNEGTGEYREYYSSGKLKTKGSVVNENREGKWEYFFEDGKLEGECNYEEGKGTYKGYYPSGSLQTKGQMENEKKVGTWEIYETDGKLSGYYKPFYEDKKISKEVAELAGKSSIDKVITRGKHFTYFDPRFNEFKGVIVSTDPVFVAIGRFPLSVEFYLQERLGHEFEFIGIRDPFFTADQNIAPGKKFLRGYSVSIKQKFYNPLKAGMWYFGHEIRFTNLGHHINVSLPQFPEFYFTASSYEQRIEYGILLGYRIMKRNNSSGFTIDAFVSYDIGYRGFDVDEKYESYFEDLKQSNFSSTFHFGLNFGNVFSFR